MIFDTTDEPGFAVRSVKYDRISQVYILFLLRLLANLHVLCCCVVYTWISGSEMGEGVWGVFFLWHVCCELCRIPVDFKLLNVSVSLRLFEYRSLSLSFSIARLLCSFFLSLSTIFTLQYIGRIYLICCCRLNFYLGGIGRLRDLCGFV